MQRFSSDLRLNLHLHGLSLDGAYGQDERGACFEAQLELAAEIGKPVFLHDREAHDDSVRILSRWRPSGMRADVKW